MDSKQQLNQLDPKLQEAYNRVMGTATVPPSSTPAQPSAPQTPPPQPSSAVVEPPSPQPAQPPPPVVPQTPVAPAVPEVLKATVSVAAAPAASGFVASSNANAQVGKKHGTSKIIYIFGGFTFFVIYTLVWVKIFHLSLPFLPQ